MCVGSNRSAREQMLRTLARRLRQGLRATVRRGRGVSFVCRECFYEETLPRTMPSMRHPPLIVHAD
eukprot:55336-Pyramimonas_sp.AAC.1